METRKSIKEWVCLMFLGLASYTALVIWINQQYFIRNLIQNQHDDDDNVKSNKNKEPPLPEVELYEIMTKQYDVPNGTYEGVPFKKILYWNEGVTLSGLYYGIGVGRDVFKEAGCPVWQCETSLNKTNLSQYDALIFRHNTWDGSTSPKERWPHQRYIFMEWESANWPTNGISIYKPGYTFYIYIIC